MKCPYCGRVIEEDLTFVPTNDPFELITEAEKERLLEDTILHFSTYEEILD